MTTVDLAATQTTDEPACLAHADGTRRRTLLGAAAVAVGAVCAGCSSSKSSPSATGGSTSATGGASTSSTSAAASSTSSSAAASTSDSSSATSAASSSGSSGAASPLAATSAVPVGGGTVLSDHKIVVTQPTAGTFKAFSAVCTHQGCLVGTVSNGLIVCPCHGSAYHVADGSVANGPAQSGLAPVQIKVANGEITAA